MSRCQTPGHGSKGQNRCKRPVEAFRPSPRVAMRRTCPGVRHQDMSVSDIGDGSVRGALQEGAEVGPGRGAWVRWGGGGCEVGGEVEAVVAEAELREAPR